MNDILNNLLPFIAEKYRPLVAGLLGLSPMITRAVYALMKNGGIKGAIAAVWLGTNTPKDSTTPPTGGTSTAGKVVALLLALALLAFLFTGCQSTPQKVAYESLGASALAVQAALAAYDTLAAQGKTTPAENAQVKDMYLKYQAAFAAACDVGAIYSATAGTTNVTGAAFSAYQVAQTNATEMAGDFVAFIKSFNIKL